MPKINILDRETAELIAAGEVIERPASVVKELVENSIDAGATAITVEIGHGGVRLIRVTDNGCGIEREDVPKAFLRHATSKVLRPEDLDRIGTLGFRGEALASICAVSETEILTRTATEEIGTRYTLAGECAGELAEAGCPVGTTITAKNLFYNVPARMKFLKKDSTEGTAVATLMDRLALSHPEIAFKLIRDREVKLATPGSGDLLAAIFAVYGNEFGRGLIPVECESGPIRISGYLARPECCRPSRSMEHFFINNRYVKSVTIMAAVEESYRNHIMVGKFPGCIINLAVDPSQVDVNVHPAKLEVKLSNERTVFDAVVNACRGALARMNRTVAVRDVGGKRFSDFELRNRPAEGTQTRMTVEQYRQMAESLPEKKSYSSMGTLMSGGGSEQYRRGLPPKGTSYGMGAQPPAEPRKWEPVKPKTSVEEIGVTDDEPHKKVENPAVTITDKSNEAVTLPAIGGRPVVVDLPVEEAKAERHEPVTLPMYGGKPVVIEPLEPTAQREEPEQAQEPEPDYRLIGEVFATYIMAERDNEMLLIDKHAAHERILFNRLKRQHQSGAVERQVLLVPLTIHMPRELYDAAIKNLDCFERAGFAAEDFGEGCLRVREVPTILEDTPAEDLLTELCERLLHRGGMDEEAIYDELYHSVACKAAIKGNIPSMEREQQELLRLLREDPTVRNCPHGRPVAIVITRRELEKMFGRIV